MNEQGDAFQEAFREVMALSDEEFAKRARAMVRGLRKREARGKKGAK